ncbi:hypothetical protein [Kingella potus]|uniref:hypothetical protein n=1 Tax=Kingella potus TaxID=265175 RepID=UPI001FD19084|nr:hypothetical protein [Kingella potus]UOP01496.1 hypothetical protein LVJ84_04710 [Kingella potus]
MAGQRCGHCPCGRQPAPAHRICARQPGRIERVSGISADSGRSETYVYRYDMQGRLKLVRSMDADNLGTHYGYTDGGELFGHGSRYLGAAAQWISGGGQWSGRLNGEQRFTFAVRESELASTVQTPGASGSIIIAVRHSPDSRIRSEHAIGSHTDGTIRTTLLKISRSGLQQFSLLGEGRAEISLAVAADLNRDGKADAQDSAAWEEAFAKHTRAGDLDGNGQTDNADRQILYTGYGYRANLAPAVQSGDTFVRTHTDLAVSGSLDDNARDWEGDSVFWRILGSRHGEAQLLSDGPHPGIQARKRLFGPGRRYRTGRRRLQPQRAGRAGCCRQRCQTRTHPHRPHQQPCCRTKHTASHYRRLRRPSRSRPARRLCTL